jgi:hypothetical protein
MISCFPYEPEKKLFDTIRIHSCLLVSLANIRSHSRFIKKPRNLLRGLYFIEFVFSTYRAAYNAPLLV